MFSPFPCTKIKVACKYYLYLCTLHFVYDNPVTGVTGWKLIDEWRKNEWTERMNDRNEWMNKWMNENMHHRSGFCSVHSTIHTVVLSVFCGKQTSWNWNCTKQFVITYFHCATWCIIVHLLIKTESPYGLFNPNK